MGHVRGRGAGIARGRSEQVGFADAVYVTAAEARSDTLRVVASAKNDIGAAKAALYDALGQLGNTVR